MIMADVLTWFFIVTGLYLTLVCHWLAASALFPRVVEACRVRYSRPLTALLLGVVLAAPCLALGAAGAHAPHPAVSAAGKGLLFLLALPALVGSAGLALRIGAGLPSPADVAQPWRPVLRGGLVLAGTFLLPFVGWFVVLPFSLVSGFGAMFSALLRRPTPVGEPVTR